MKKKRLAAMGATQFWLTCIRRPVAKGHLVVFEFDQAAVADGGPASLGEAAMDEVRIMR